MTAEVILLIVLAIIAVPAGVAINLWWAKREREEIIRRANRSSVPARKLNA